MSRAVALVLLGGAGGRGRPGWRPRVSRAVAPVLLAALVSGCAAAGSGSVTPTATPTPTPVGACPAPVDGPDPTNCVPYDPDAAAAQNEVYRQRHPLPSADAAAIRPYVARVRSALQPLTAGSVRPEAARVRSALAAAGFPQAAVTPDRTAVGPAANVGFGIATNHGCVYGLVDAGRLEVTGGGATTDGACLEPPTH